MRLGKLASSGGERECGVRSQGCQKRLELLAEQWRICLGQFTLGQFGAKAAAATPKIRALHNDRDVQVKRAASKALALIEDSQRPEAP